MTGIRLPWERSRSRTSRLASCSGVRNTKWTRPATTSSQASACCRTPIEELIASDRVGAESAIEFSPSHWSLCNAMSGETTTHGPSAMIPASW